MYLLQYGAIHQPPRLSLEIELLEEDKVDVRLKVHNLAGPGHASLLALGDERFNTIAATHGQRAHAW